jgi:hypothetical protein
LYKDNLSIILQNLDEEAMSVSYGVLQIVAECSSAIVHDTRYIMMIPQERPLAIMAMRIAKSNFINFNLRKWK